MQINKNITLTNLIVSSNFSSSFDEIWFFSKFLIYSAISRSFVISEKVILDIDFSCYCYFFFKSCSFIYYFFSYYYFIFSNIFFNSYLKIYSLNFYKFLKSSSSVTQTMPSFNSNNMGLCTPFSNSSSNSSSESNSLCVF